MKAYLCGRIFGAYNINKFFNAQGHRSASVYIKIYTHLGNYRSLSQGQWVTDRRLYTSSRKLSQFYHGVKGSQVGVFIHQNTHLSDCYHILVLSPSVFRNDIIYSGISEKLTTHVFISCSR